MSKETIMELEKWVMKHKNHLGYSSQANITDELISLVDALRIDLEAMESRLSNKLSSEHRTSKRANSREGLQ